MKDTTEPNGQTVPETPLLFSVNSLRAHLSRVPDPRKARGIRYALPDLLTLLILAKLGGEDSLKGMVDWLRLRETTTLRLLRIKRDHLPHQTTYERLLAKLDSDELERQVGAFFAQSLVGKPVTVALDGKVLRGTIPEGDTQGVHLLAAYVPDHSVVLFQMEVADKASEISAAPQVLAAINLTGCVVTGDALFTQRELCQQITQAGGDYVFPVKDNQPGLRQAIADVFVPPVVSAGHSPVPLPERCAQTVDCAHGRIEYRYLTASSELNDYLDWPQVGQVFRLQRVVQRLKTGKLRYEVVFGVTSLPAATCSPQRLMTLIRHHWHIENRLHYVRDVSLGEDACSIRHAKRQRVLACLNNLVIALLRRTDYAYIPEARRFFSLHFDQALNLLL